MQGSFLIFTALFIRVIKVILKKCSRKRRDWKGFSVKVNIVYQYLLLGTMQKLFDRNIFIWPLLAWTTFLNGLKWTVFNYHQIRLILRIISYTLCTGFFVTPTTSGLRTAPSLFHSWRPLRPPPISKPSLADLSFSGEIPSSVSIFSAPLTVQSLKTSNCQSLPQYHKIQFFSLFNLDVFYFIIGTCCKIKFYE